MAAMTDPISPAHYKRGKLETVDVIMDLVRDLPGDEAILVGNAIKYLSRYRFKHGTSPLQDARKAEWYIKKLVALLKTKPSAGSIKKEYPLYPVDH
jgi:hypothetical protein